MRRVVLAALALTSALSPLCAEELSAFSQVEAVTVFPSGAEVTRTVSLEVPAGEHSLTVADLPGDIDPASVRVEATAVTDLTIGSVDVRSEVVKGDDVEARRKAIEARIESLEAESRALDRAIANQNFQKDLLGSLGKVAIEPRKGEGVSVISADDLAQLLDLAGGRLSAINQAITAAEERQRAIVKEIEELRREEELLAPQQTYRSIITIALTAPAAGEARFAVRYSVFEAGWSPVYDARLDTGSGDRAPSLTLVSRAEVVQRSAEPWTGVELTLSTARVTGATEAPELQPDPLSPRPPMAEMQGKSDQAAAPALQDRMSDMAATARAREEEAQVDIAGFQALYRIAGRQSVGNAGEAKGVRIASQDIAAALEAVTVPRIDTNAYLTARFKLSGEAPSLPGAVMLYRDGVFLGRGGLPLLNPGEEHALGFGADDKVKVKRDETVRKSGETGIISTDNVEERAYSTTIENLHERAIDVRLIDRMPISTHEDIKVEMLAGMTAPDERNVDKKRGVVAWLRNLKPGEKATINFGYRVTWPKGMDLPPIQ